MLDTRVCRRRPPDRSATAAWCRYAGAVGRFTALLGLVLVLILAVAMALVLALALTAHLA